MTLSRPAAGRLDAHDVVEHLAVPAGEEGSAVDHHVDLGGAGIDRHLVSASLPPDWIGRRGKPWPPSDLDARAGKRLDGDRHHVGIDADRRRRGVSGLSGSGCRALRASVRTLPGVSAPSSVVRSTIEIARSIAASFEAFLIDRVASPRPAARHPPGRPRAARAGTGAATTRRAVASTRTDRSRRTATACPSACGDGHRSIRSLRRRSPSVQRHRGAFDTGPDGATMCACRRRAYQDPFRTPNTPPSARWSCSSTWSSSSR